jgi:hypothetical protein
LVESEPPVTIDENRACSPHNKADRSAAIDGQENQRDETR